MRNRILLLVALAGLGFLLVPRREHWERYSGETMGTTFRVVWSSRDRAGAADRIRRAIDEILEQVDRQMSTYRPDSEIRRFADAPAGDWFPVAPETEAVVREALALAELTGGAFDPTVAPLVDLWGFGPAGRRSSPPDSAAIAAARRRIGWEQVETRSAPPALRRTAADVSLDLSAIAKGHGVDRIGTLLDAAGADRYLVDIGGEVRVLGDGPSGTGWRVELESPEAAGAGAREPGSLCIRSGAVATSGTYRNEFDANGVHFHHAIDPRTGYPTRHGGVQVTTVAETCQTADGRATALLVLGPQEGSSLAEKEGWAARFLVVVATDPPPGTDPSPVGAADRIQASTGPDRNGAGVPTGFEWREVVTTAFARMAVSGSGESGPR